MDRNKGFERLEKGNVKYRFVTFGGSEEPELPALHWRRWQMSFAKKTSTLV
jgi:hypothetical protein